MVTEGVNATNKQDKLICFNDLKTEFLKYLSDSASIDKIQVAYEVAEKYHRGQKRWSGAAYINHPLWTAFYLAQWRLSPTIIMAGLLHDVLEDTDISEAEIEEKFGADILKLVKSVTKVSTFAQKNRTQITADYLRKLYLGMAKDIRVILIKLADRLHNINTLQFLPKKKQKIVSEETIKIYCGIAHRLGMNQLKKQFEEICFANLHEKEYYEISRKLELDHQERNSLINEKVESIKNLIINEKKIPALIYGRAKTIYSIHNKMVIQGKLFKEIHDLFALRIIVDTVDQCYMALGYIHQQFIPLKNRFKDYIATPKSNFYRSLHTSIIFQDGTILEIQIRTKEMDEFAEKGVAAHWKYKENTKYHPGSLQENIDEKISIFRDILNLEKVSAEQASDLFKQVGQQDQQAKDDLLNEIIQNEIFSYVVYVLTPMGAMFTLPYGSTVLDFAYHIHSEVGDTTQGAKINGQFSPIATQLHSGDVVEILTNKNQTPNESWLKIVKTNRALNKIRKFLRNQNEENLHKKRYIIQNQIAQIKSEIRHYIKNHKLKPFLIPRAQQIKRAKALGFKNMDEFLLECINNPVEYPIQKITKLVFVNSIEELETTETLAEEIKKRQRAKAQLQNDVIVEDSTSIKIQFAKCCLPIPYEAIVGQISKQSGIKIHKANCVNLQQYEHRLLEVKWNEAVTKHRTYETFLKLVCTDRPGLIADISKILNNQNVSIGQISARLNRKKLLTIIRIIISVNHADQLNKVIKTLKMITNINSVKREKL